MGILPEVGATYPSFEAFRLDCFERGYQNSLTIITKANNERHQYNTCGIRIGPEKTWCSFQVNGISRDGVIVVKKVNEKHTCPASIREAMSDRARRVMGRKVEATKRSMKGRGKLRKQRKPKAAPDSGAEEEDETDPYPTSSELAEEVENLRKSGVLHFPPPDQPFNTVRDLFIHLHAFVQQQGFTIWRRSTITSPPRVELACYRGQNRLKNSNGGRCTFAIRTKKRHGLWWCTGVTGSHSHPVGYEQKVNPFFRGARGASFVSNPFPQSSHRNNPSSSSTLQLRPSRSRSRATPPTDPSPDPSPLSAQPYSISNYQPELVSFLNSFNPIPSMLKKMLIALPRANITSVEELVSVLSMEDSEFGEFSSSVDEEVEEILLEMISELREDEAWMSSLMD